MPRNEYCSYDIMYITRPTRNIMSALGIWPSISGDKSFWEKIYKFALIVISYTLLSCNLIPGFLYWMIQGDTRTRLQMIPFLIYDTMTVSQYGIFVFQHDRIRGCLRHIQEDWENVHGADLRNIMLKFAKTGKILVTLCASFMFSGAVLFRTILPLLQENILTDQNVTIRPLACPSYLVFIDAQITPVYETLLTIQCVSGFITASIATGACGLTAIFVVHASGQLRILRVLITNLVEAQWQKEMEIDKRFAKIVEHQIRVRGFLQMVHCTLQEIFLMEIMVNTLSLCLLMYFIIIEWQSKNIAAMCIYLLCVGNLIIHIFMYCYTGEQLTVQAEKVATVSCELEWYRLPDKKARYVVLLMIMSNAPTKITAGNLFDLSFKTFGDAMKAAGAYFNMLRNLTM